MQFKNNQLNDLKNQVESNTSQLKKQRKILQHPTKTLKEIEEAVVFIVRNKDEEEHNLNEADQAYYNLRNQLNEKESELRHKVKEKEQVEHLLDCNKGQAQRIEASVGRNERTTEC